MDKIQQLNQTVNHLFRREYGKMVSVLVKIFGTENLELAEDVVQDALLSALETWKFKGLPDNPGAWLYRVAKNKAVDIIRKNKHGEIFDFNDAGRQLLKSEYTLNTKMDQYWENNQLKDDFLNMMYVCCLPQISRENQITFILKILCGFSTKEIAKAFLTSEDTISKRLLRTREYFRKTKIRPEIPSGAEMKERTGSVLAAIYLIFNEGYNSTHSDQLIREDLIHHAFFLCKSLLENKKTNLPEVNALMALMCFHSARSRGRLGNDGELILLPDQDRGVWNQEMISLGNEYMNKAAVGNSISHYHYEAAIAYEHCIARNYKNTNWQQILYYYDALLLKEFNPVIALNRAIVVLEMHGPRKALEAMSHLQNSAQLERYYLYYAILGEIYQRSGENERAHENYQKARYMSQSNPERKLLEKKIESLRNS